VKTSAIDRVLRTASARLRWTSFGRVFHLAFLIAAGALLALLLAARLLALLPAAWFGWLTLAAVPAAAMLAGLFALRRPHPLTVARAIDRGIGSKELFLSAALVGKTPAAYRELVLEQAEARAEKVKVGQFMPLPWARGARNLLLACAALVAALLWLPQFDPFKSQARRDAQDKVKQRLEETKKITAARQEELKEKGSVLTEQVKQALVKLDQTLKQAKPLEREANAKKLNEEAQDFSELWKKAASQLPKNATDQMERAAQNFGDGNKEQQLKEMVDKLKQGDPSALKEAMEKLRKELQEIAKEPDGADKKEKLEKLAKEMGKMANQLRDKLGEQGMNDAMKRALEQMDMAKLEKLAKDALDGANESMKLGEEELERLGEMFKDAKNLEDAMKNLQAAKQLNDKGKLDGKDAEGAGGDPAKYKELYDKLMAENQGEGDGDGQGQGDKDGNGKSGKNKGRGNGGTVGEAPESDVNFKKEKDPTQLGAGRLLLQFKEDGIGDIGEKAGDYEAAIRAVKQGAAEAIRNEQVPPGYHKAIQKYFDRMEPKASAAPSKAAPPTETAK
jgi:hypothetical protein